MVAHTRATLLIASFSTTGASNAFGQLTIMHNKPVIPPRALELYTLGFLSGVSTDGRMSVGVPVTMRRLGLACCGADGHGARRLTILAFLMENSEHQHYERTSR